MKLKNEILKIIKKINKKISYRKTFLFQKQILKKKNNNNQINLNFNIFYFNNKSII